MDLAEFLQARIAEDEAWARGFEQTWDGYDGRPNPERIYAECDAKRQIVAHLSSAYEEEARGRRAVARYGVDNREAGEQEFAGSRLRQEMECVAQHLAVPYAAHADYQQEWKP